MQAIGIDFGTTNSALAVMNGDGSPRLANFRFESGRTNVFRSILYFEMDEDTAGGRRITAGPDAITRYVESCGSGRLMQSLKTFLASHHATKTRIFNKEYHFEQLIGYMIRLLRTQSEEQFGPLQGKVVAGRPVHFAHADGPEGDAFAESRLREAFAFAGFEQVEFELEPIAAARHYERRLDHDEVILVADFGGGTSDFCVLRVGPRAHTLTAAERLLGVSGVGVAGDALDARLVDHLVAPQLGKDTEYRTEMGRWTTIPSWIYNRLKNWNELSLLKSKQNMVMLHQMARWAKEPERLADLLYLVDHDLGFAMSARIQQAKAELSCDEQGMFRFADGPIDIKAPVDRGDFEEWTTPEAAGISQCLDDLLAKIGVAPQDVDRVFLTGGTAQVPAILRLFQNRFGDEKLVSGDYHTSVVSGLALCAGGPSLRGLRGSLWAISIFGPAVLPKMSAR